MRKDECLARYGGNEFAFVLPETPRGRAIEVLDKIRQLVGAHSFTFGGQILPVTFSAGVAELPAGEESPLAFIAAADAKLYKAKKRGRNQVVG